MLWSRGWSSGRILGGNRQICTFGMAVVLGVAFSTAASADTAVVHAYAEIVWGSMSLVFTPDDAQLPPGSSYVSWDEDSQYSGAAIDMAWWNWPNMETVGDYYADHSGPDPEDPDYSAAGNGWGSGDVSHDLGPAAGQAQNEGFLVAGAEIFLSEPDSFAESLSGAVQGGLLTTQVAGTLNISFDYIVFLEVIATGDASASGEALAEFILFNASDDDPDAPLVLDSFQLTGSVLDTSYTNSDIPEPLSGNWSGEIALGAGDQAAFEAFVFAMGQGETPPVPEPASALLFLTGLPIWALSRRSKK